jgi:hypothetical protein
MTLSTGGAGEHDIYNDSGFPTSSQTVLCW